MGGFKPIGSEKLEGMDKIRRIMEIARYNENIPQSVNETKSTEYSIDFADGNTYRIEKERQGYIIKMAINESESDYIEPMKSRKYYSSYSSALKRLNLMAKEINVLHENEEGISLIGEQKKKFILKTKKKKVADEPAQETPPPAEPAPAPEPLPAPPPIPEEGSALPPPPTDMGSPEGGMGEPAPDMGAPEGGMGEPAPDMGAPEGGMEEPAPDMGAPEGGMEEPGMGMEDEEEDIEIEKKPKEKKVSDLKRIQILVGKLAQKIRTYEEDKELTPKEIKYIINSILSAIDVEVLDEDDIEQIIDKLEGTDEDEGGDEEEVSFEETDDEEVAPEPPAEPEMAEGYDNINDAFNDYFGGAYAAQASKALKSEMGEEDKPYEELHRNERRRKRHYPNVDHLEHGTFSESSVDKVLSKYFILNESEEKKYQNTKDQKTNRIYNTNKQNIIKLAESSEQLSVALEYIKENQRVKLLGLSNKGNLIFKEGINEVRITKSGKLI